MLPMCGTAQICLILSSSPGRMPIHGPSVRVHIILFCCRPVVGFGTIRNNKLLPLVVRPLWTHLNALGECILRMAGRLRTKLTESLKIIHGHLVACKVQHGILQGACVPIGQHKPITVRPVRRCGIIFHCLLSPRKNTSDISKSNSESTPYLPSACLYALILPQSAAFLWNFSLGP